MREHASPAGCLTKRLAQEYVTKSNCLSLVGSGYFLFMINTINVANAMANVNVSYTDIEPPPSSKGG